MSEKALNRLFESKAKVKVLKIFLQNPDESFDAAEVAKMIRAPKRQCLRYIREFVSIGLIKPVKQVRNGKNKKNQARQAKKARR